MAVFYNKIASAKAEEMLLCCGTENYAVSMCFAVPSYQAP
jgi:hypothetical protein